MIIAISPRHAASHFVWRALGCLEAPYVPHADKNTKIARAHTYPDHIELIKPEDEVILSIRHPQLVAESWAKRGYVFDYFPKMWEGVNAVIPSATIFDIDRHSVNDLDDMVSIDLDSREDTVINHPTFVGYGDPTTIPDGLVESVLALPNVASVYS